MERWLQGAMTPDAPLYDLEECDGLGLIVRVIATGITAAKAVEILSRELLDATEIR